MRRAGSAKPRLRTTDRYTDRSRRPIQVLLAIRTHHTFPRVSPDAVHPSMSRMSDLDRRVRGSLLTVAVAASCACGLFGPSESVEGLWQGTSPARGTVYLTLHQDDDRITGFACFQSPQSASVPVISTYPYVKFTPWEGKLEKSGAIVSTKISDLATFSRTDSLSPRCSCSIGAASTAPSGCYF